MSQEVTLGEHDHHLKRGNLQWEEQNNALQRHWLGKFRRRTQAISRFLKMIDFNRALFQRFRVNGSVNERISLLR